jgi:anaerobic selenocysteine-containing dehydrogenase
MTTETVQFRTCPLCEATCGLEITVRDGRVHRTRGDRDNPFSQGFICPKGSVLQHVHGDPDRLRRPLIRRGDDPATAVFEEIGWEEAFAEVERRLLPIIERHGRDAVALYLGNPSAHSLAGVLYNRPLARALGTRNIYSASTVDQMPKHVSSGLLFGGPLLIPVPDLDRTDHLLMLGANPWESNGSLCTAPDFPGRLARIRQRGGKVVVVDPRRTRTAEEADEHVAIRPGTDAHLLAAMANVLLGEGLAEPGRLRAFATGLDELRELLAPITPEVASAACGIDPGTIRRLARELAAAPTAAVYGRIGTHTVAFGTLAAWAVDVLNVLTGNLDRPGGAMFPTPAHERPRAPGPGRGYRTGRHRSRVRGYPEVNGELPVATLAEEIETPGEGQVRALITVAGNPVMSTPDAARLDRALAGLELMVSVDIYRNETTRHAHLILPPPSALERSEYHLAFFGLSVRNVAQWSPPLFEPAGPAEHEILAKLALIASGQGAGADPALVEHLLVEGVLQGAIGMAGSPIAGRPVDELVSLLAGPSAVDRILDAMIRTGPYGDWFGAVPDGLSLAALGAHEHGLDLGPLQPRLPELLRTPSGTIELVPEPIAADIPRLLASCRDAAEGAGGSGGVGGTGLVLVGRRHLRSNNSWMHNIAPLVKGKPRCTLQLHPDDAARLGLADGDPAEVRSRVGAVVAPVEITEAIRPGVVSLPHGWGHGVPGSGLSVAAEHAGVNSNVLTDGEVVDPLSGNAVLNGIPVTVTPLASDLSPRARGG